MRHAVFTILLAFALSGTACQHTPPDRTGWNDFFQYPEHFVYHYKLYQAGFDALAAQFDKQAPLGNTDVCLSAFCKQQADREPDREETRQILKMQRRLYPQLVSGLHFVKGQFLLVQSNGELSTISYGWEYEEYGINASLHYTGGAPPDVPVCKKTPTNGWGACALPLSDTWFIRYDWMDATIFKSFPPPGTSDAECRPAANISFAAFTDCLKNSEAPPAKPICEFDHSMPDKELAREAYDQCIHDAIDEDRRRRKQERR